MTDISPSHDPATAASPTVQVHDDAAVRVITIDRPADLGALDAATRAGLIEALSTAADDPHVRVVVLTGTGRGFCVGHDLKEHLTAMTSPSHEGPLDRVVNDDYNPLALLVATMPKPVIAALNGVTAGAGASLALAADLRIASADSGINLAFTGIALSCDTGASWFLPRLVGPAKAIELLFQPRTLSAGEALELGLVTSVVPAAQLDHAVRELAQRLACGPTAAYAAVKAAIAFSASHDLPESLAREAELMAATGATEDHRAAVAAFVAKERPTFVGH